MTQQTQTNTLRRYQASDVPEHGMESAFLRIVHGVFEAASNQANDSIGATPDEKHSRHVSSDGGYKCIHLNVRDFVNTINRVMDREEISDRKLGTLRFLDIGCGVGQKVYLAQVFGFLAFGLELRNELIIGGKKTFHTIGAQTNYFVSAPVNNEQVFIQGDALTFSDYSKFDVLYFYCPLFDRELQSKMELHLAKTAKVGAIVIPKLPKGVFSSPERAKDFGWQHTNSGLSEHYVRKEIKTA